jgi:AcrR family transcriptional regulator
MGDGRQRLTELLAAEIGANGLNDRSLRELAAAVGSNHRMLNYHYGSRAGLVAALVNHVEDSQRKLLRQLAEQAASPGELLLTLWTHLATPAMLPSVRLFFECVSAGAGQQLTDPWLKIGAAAATTIGVDIDPTDLRIGIAVTRGLLIDVLTTGDPGPATKAIERYVQIWTSSRQLRASPMPSSSRK